MDVRQGNQRRKKAAAALLAQMQARTAGNASAGLGGVRQSGGLARAGAKAGIIRGQGRGIPAGLEGLYARAGDFARQNQLGDYSLNAEQQVGAPDPGVFAGGYATANAPISDPGGVGGQAQGVQDPVVAGAQAQESQAVEGSTAYANQAQGVGVINDPGLSDLQKLQTLVPGYGSTLGGPLQGQTADAPRDGQPMNGGIYYQGTIIPMGVWRAISQGL
jgi:hypothetical protein